MVTPTARAAVLVAFPFSGLPQAKLSPAEALAPADQGKGKLFTANQDLITAQVGILTRTFQPIY